MALRYLIQPITSNCPISHQTYSHFNTVNTVKSILISTVMQMDTSPLVHFDLVSATKLERHLVSLVSVDNQKSIFTCPVFDLTFRHGQTYGFLWTTKFQSGQVNHKSYLPRLATKHLSADSILNWRVHYFKMAADNSNMSPLIKSQNRDLNTKTFHGVNDVSVEFVCSFFDKYGSFYGQIGGKYNRACI